MTGDLAELPFPQLLLELLSRGRSGELVLDLGVGPRNVVWLDRGIPVALELPDVPPGALSGAIRDGTLDDALGLPAGARPPPPARRAESKLASACGLERGRFVFEARSEVPLEGRVLLHPLAVVFRGLAGAPAVRGRCLPPGPRRLAASYPHGSDPFRWGPALEAAVGEPELERLQARGISVAWAEAALACLHLTGLLEPAPAAPPRPTPAGPPPSVRREPEAGAETDGLVLHRRGSMVTPPVRRVPQGLQPELRAEPALESKAAAAPPSDEGRVREALASFRGKSYLQILRVGPETDGAQLERAFRHFVKRARDEGEGPGSRAVVGMLWEAYSVLRDPEPKQRYVDATPAERRHIEADAKAERALLAMAERRGAEAVVLGQWACEMMPERAELGALLAGLQWLSEPKSERSRALEAALAKEAKRSRDPRLHIVLVAVLARSGEKTAARALWKAAGRPGHPLVQVYLPEAER